MERHLEVGSQKFRKKKKKGGGGGGVGEWNFNLHDSNEEVPKF